MTYGTARWVYSRNRMLQVDFGDGNGKATPPSRGTTIAEKLDLPPQSLETVALWFAPPEEVVAQMSDSRLIVGEALIGVGYSLSVVFGG